MPRGIRAAWGGVPHVCQLLLIQNSSSLDLGICAEQERSCLALNIFKWLEPPTHLFSAQFRISPPGHRASSSLTLGARPVFLSWLVMSCFRKQSRWPSTFLVCHLSLWLPPSCFLLPWHSALSAWTVCVVLLWWQPQHLCVCGSESLSYGTDALSHEGREAAIPSGVGGLGGPLASGILPFFRVPCKVPSTYR